MQKTFALFCLPLLLCVFIFSALAQEPGLRPGRVSSESLIVRAKPASYYERLTQLKKGEAVQVLSKKEDWYEILLPESVRAWVRSDSLDEAGQVLGDTCFLSAGAGDFFTPYFHVPQGTRLKRIGAPTDGWTQVQPPENASAWVHADYVSLDEEREASQEDATIADALPGALAKQREELKKEHAKQQELLLEEQQKLALLRQQAEQLQKSSQEDAAGLEKLQREAERLQALKEAAEAKAELARLQREKAGIQAEAEQNKLEALKRQAEEKARSVISEKTKWEEEAKKTALAIEAAQLAAKQEAEQARQEALQLEQEREAAVLKAEEAIKKAMQAEEKMQESEKRQAATLAAIAELQKEMEQAEEKVLQLRQERERMELATRTELAKLEAAKLEAEQLALEKRDMAILLEKSKKEREEISRKAEEEARQLAEIKEKTEAQNREKELILAKQAQLNEDKDGQKRLLLSIPVAEKTAEPQLAETAEKAPENVVKAVDLPQPIEEADRSSAQKTAPKAEVKAEAKTEAQAPLPEPPVLKAEPPERFEGVLLSLRNQASVNATHVLCERKDYSLQPMCYLISRLIDLNEWENQDVTLSGKKVKIPNWRRPIIIVDSIQKNK